MEQRLGPAQVVGDVDPVVGLDVAVVVLDPLGPGFRALGKAELVGSRLFVVPHGLSVPPSLRALGLLVLPGSSPAAARSLTR